MAETVFHKILSGDIPADKIFEDERVLVISDINPKAPVHLLIIPKEKDISSIKNIDEADSDLLGHMMVVAKNVAKDKNLAGYKLIFNVGAQGGQEIDYLHLHLLGGWDRETDADSVRT